MVFFSPSVPSPLPPGLQTVEMARVGNNDQYYKVHFMCGVDESCILNQCDVVPFGNQEAYLVIIHPTAHKWHHVKLRGVDYIEIYCTNTCCVLTPTHAGRYIHRMLQGASNDTLLGLLHDNEDLPPMFFRVIYRIPMDAGVTRASESFLYECSINKVVDVASWLWWYHQ